MLYPYEYLLYGCRKNNGFSFKFFCNFIFMELKRANEYKTNPKIWEDYFDFNFSPAEALSMEIELMGLLNETGGVKPYWNDVTNI